MFVATSNNPQVGFTSRGSKARCGASVGWLAGTTGIQRAGRGGQVRRIPAGKGTTTQPEAVWYSGSLASTFIWQEPENCPRHGLPCTCHFRPLFRSPYLSKEWNHCFASTKEYPLTDALTLTIFVCTVQFNNFRSKSEESRDLLIQNLSCAKAIWPPASSYGHRVLDRGTMVLYAARKANINGQSRAKQLWLLKQLFTKTKKWDITSNGSDRDREIQNSPILGLFFSFSKLKIPLWMNLYSKLNQIFANPFPLAPTMTHVCIRLINPAKLGTTYPRRSWKSL